MRRRVAAVTLALLLAISAVGPAGAADPSADPPDPTATPTAEPTPISTVEPPTPDPTATPTAEPTPISSPTATVEPPAATPTAEPPAPTPAGLPTVLTDADGRPIPDGRYIVILDPSANMASVITRHRQRDGIRADRRFDRAVRAFTASLDGAQRRALLSDPQVLAVVPDEVIELTAQTTPTGVARVGARKSSVASIDNIDQRVDADVAIVDTGVAVHPDLNVVGGVNCASSDRAAWADQNGHGTHVAGTVAALDNDVGVVGVAPGARIWAVRILNADGYGLLSWYVCGLDWILAQRDPTDASRPLIESVNMSVAKTGRDDLDCGVTNKDVLHQAICRLSAAGITIVAAAANEGTSASGFIPAAYNEVITVSALADTDGKAGGLGGGRCYSWGTYDVDDTFADFSNYGSDVDIIAPGKCIWSTKPNATYGYSSGTSMAAPAVAGAVALYKASRPAATPSEVRESLRYLGNLDWTTSTDPDGIHEPLLDVSRIAYLGSYAITTDPEPILVSSGGRTLTVPVTVTRGASFFERVRLSLLDVPSGWTARLETPSLYGWDATGASVTVTVPATADSGTYTFKVVGRNWGRTRSSTITIEVVGDIPEASPPTAVAATKVSMGLLADGATTLTLRVGWPAATDPSDPIAGYEVQHSVNDGAWTSTIATTASSRTAVFRALTVSAGHRFRVRAQDTDGDWSGWATTPSPYLIVAVGDRSSAVTYRGTWRKMTHSAATGRTITTSTQRGATVTHRFTGRGVAIVAPTSAVRGKASVYIDGVLRTTIDLRTSTIRHRRVVYALDFGVSGTHTITIRVLGTAGRPMVSLDGIVILR